MRVAKARLDRPTGGQRTTTPVLGAARPARPSCAFPVDAPRLAPRRSATPAAPPGASPLQSPKRFLPQESLIPLHAVARQLGDVPRLVPALARLGPSLPRPRRPPPRTDAQ